MKRFSKFVNTVLKFIQNRDVKGKYWFFLKTRERLKGRLIKHDYGRSQFFVPYEQWCFWKTLGPHNYYLDEINPFIDTLNKELENFDLFDLGADVGVISLITSLNCPKLKTIHAFEPNPNSYRILALNADSNHLPFFAVNQAVSNFSGKVYLNFESDEHSDHEGHIDPDRPGNCQVTSLDSYLNQYLKEQQATSTYPKHQLSRHIALKIDVEGQEKQVIMGASKTIEAAEKVVVLLEIHPETLDREGQTPEELFTALETYGAVKWNVPLLDKDIDRNVPFFKQFETQQYDVIGVLTPKG